MTKKKRKKDDEIEGLKPRSPHTVLDEVVPPLSYHKFDCEDPKCPCENGYWHCTRCDAAVEGQTHPDCPDATTVKRPIPIFIVEDEE